MGYLNENGLARYDGLIKNWVTLKSGTVDGVKPLLNWQKTSTAGAVTCYPLPAAPLDPVVNFLFSETGPAEGTKGPDNPSTITGVTQAKVTRCGKNLVPYIPAQTFTINGVSFSVAADGRITVNGTAGTGNANFDLSTSNVSADFASAIPVLAGHTYTVSGCPSGGSSSTYCMFGALYDKGGHAVAYNVLNDTGSGKSYTPSVDGYIFLRITITAGYTASSLVFSPQIEEASTATSYESPERSVYTLSLGNTFYGGSVDLSAGTMTVTHEKVLIDTFSQISNVYASTVLFYFNVASFETSGFAAGQTPTWGCDKFNLVGDSSEEYARQSGNPRQLYISVDKSRLDVSGASDQSNPTMAEWLAAGKAWVANNIITFIAERKTPAVIQLTPTQIYSLSQSDPYTPRINTVYSDQISVHVGYPKSPQATAAELTNAIISLGGEI